MILRSYEIAKRFQTVSKHVLQSNYEAKKTNSFEYEQISKWYPIKEFGINFIIKVKPNLSNNKSRYKEISF